MSDDEINQIFIKLLNEYLEEMLLISKEKATTKVAAMYNNIIEGANGNAASIIISSYEELTRLYLSDAKEELFTLSEKIHHFNDQNMILRIEFLNFYRKWGIDIKFEKLLRDHLS